MIPRPASPPVKPKSVSRIDAFVPLESPRAPRSLTRRIFEPPPTPTPPGTLREDRQGQVGEDQALRGRQEPPRFKHMVVNAKKLQLEEDRLVEIEHQNRKLLDNLSRISERPSGLSGDNGASRGSTARPKALLRGQAPVKRRVTSLNVRKRQEELDRIERENALILRRIRDQSNRESEFSVKKMQSEWKETLEHRKRASQWIG